MPVAVAVQQTSLTPDLLNNSISKAVPDVSYEEIVKPLHDKLISSGIDPTTVTFDPAKHILFTDDYYEKTKRLTLEDLQVTHTHQEPISPIGVTEPFPLFTEDAIDIMRYEMFQKESFLHAARISDVSKTGDLDMYIRGYAKQFAPFIYSAWTHPKVMEIMSKMAGVELETMIDYEVGHSNISIKSDSTKIIKPSAPVEEDPDAIEASVTWHYDSPQFVCVLMLSDTTQMVGGETCLMMGNGKVAKVEGPKKGWANVLQGRILKHIATKPKGNFSERITSVASLRPKDPLKDNCFATTVKPSVYAGSRYNDFYKDWMNYRLNVLTDRIKILQNQINEQIDEGKLFDQIETIDFIQKKIVEYAEHTWQEFEVVDDGLVEKPASYNVIKARW